MEPISVSHAFEIAPPRRAAVLCLQGPHGSTDMIATQWFTWLNLRRQPMLSFSLECSASLGLNLSADDKLLLAFPPEADVPGFLNGVRTAEKGREKTLPAGVETAEVVGCPMLLPARSEVALRCTLAGSYRFPFKKVRIFNCNLDEALGYSLAEPTLT